MNEDPGVIAGIFTYEIHASRSFHGAGLEFKEWTHPSHYPQHLQLELKPGMTITLGRFCYL